MHGVNADRFSNIHVNTVDTRLQNASPCYGVVTIISEISSRTNMNIGEDTRLRLRGGYTICNKQKKKVTEEVTFAE